MRISKDETIAGLPASEARTLARCFRIPHIAGVGAESLHISRGEADAALGQPVAAAYLERTGADTDYWVTTTSGNALALASFARPITRKTADRYVEEIVDRAGTYNSDPTKLLTIDRLYVFGS
ncbi:hypothetical protein GCM10007304_46120 [Rhodococcoides trifolii]|uniref:Uncharacterized protein n=1 Tax=Rhodococcoides trifolii TaxID=908250 RepID=A0A917G7T5_9NOCA|nr:hypothetical protein [Rhodococcus trifolii]GGG27055.1 hypothetical protein GCM10007304_46120 [Rhodococcus trifolii]